METNVLDWLETTAAACHAASVMLWPAYGVSPDTNTVSGQTRFSR